MWIAPGGYAGELDSIFNDVVYFSVGERLRLIGTQIWNLWVKIQTDLSLPTAVDSMTTRTLSEKGFSPLVYCFRCRLDWTLMVSFDRRNCEVSHPPGQRRF